MKVVCVLVLLALAFCSAYAGDPSPLQDFCVAVDNPLHGVYVNGKFCKDPKKAEPEDFFLSGLNKPGNTANRDGSNVTIANVNKLPGLNTLGISLARIDYAPGGQHPPHLHPRGTALLVVVEGTLYVGFVTSADDGNRFFSKILNPGDVFVFPVGLIHFQYNIGHQNAVAYVAFSSQNAGDVYIADSVFGARPDIKPEVLAKAFQLPKNIVKDLQEKF